MIDKEKLLERLREKLIKFEQEIMNEGKYYKLILLEGKIELLEELIDNIEEDKFVKENFNEVFVVSYLDVGNDYYQFIDSVFDNEEDASKQVQELYTVPNVSCPAYTRKKVLNRKDEDKPFYEHPNNCECDHCKREDLFR